MYANLNAIGQGLCEVLKPPKRMTVSECSEKHLYIDAYNKWDSTITPYMIRPMNETTRRGANIVCFVGPARTGKTLALILGRWVYTVTCHPKDIALVHSSQDLAYDLSNREIKRLHENSPEIKAQLTNKSSDDNTYTKQYRNGAMAVLAWPSPKQLASRTFDVIMLTDYSKWPANVGSHGGGFGQASKRTETAGSLAMTIVESSPGCDVRRNAKIEPVKYVLGKPLSHGFPPTSSGVQADICPIYNNGTREWFYVPCSACGEFYPQEPSIDRFSWGTTPDGEIDFTQPIGTVCCWCGAIHGEERKIFENTNGRWLSEGCVIDCYGKITGQSRLNKTYPSFSLGGGAAAYQTRQSIVIKYIQNLKLYKETRDDKELKGIVNGDIGAPYKKIIKVENKAVSTIKKRSEQWKHGFIPDGVRFLIATADVQKNRFAIQVIGYGLDRNRWIIDRFDIKQGSRGIDNLDPASYLEDWNVLNTLFLKCYKLPDSSGRVMGISFFGCDSAGAAGVTNNAYNYYRSLDQVKKSKFYLIKGEHRASSKFVDLRMPDTSKVAARGASSGDVPVLFLNTNKHKDVLEGDLCRKEKGHGYIHFPHFLDDKFYSELLREEKDQNGKWIGDGANESSDLLIYSDAIAEYVGYSRINWQHPPTYAKSWGNNINVYPHSAVNKETLELIGEMVDNRKKKLTRSRRRGVRGRNV